jgi:hypothetical protein
VHTTSHLMRNLRITKFGYSLVSAMIIAAACERNVAPPTPLPIEQAPSALLKAFDRAKPENKEVVNQIVGALQAQDYSKAYLSLQALAVRPGLNKEQQNITTRGIMTVNNLLQSAQTKGDAKAAETLNSYRINK